MRAESILRRVLADVSGELHRARLGAVIAAVAALIHGGRVGLAALGRAIGPRSHKHGIKRIDRLLGNDALAGELGLIYQAIARYTLRDTPKPVILLDWTRTRSAMCALTAAVPVAGRAVPLFSITCPLSDYAKPALERELLQKLQTLLPAQARAVLVADAGFRAPWILAVRELGFDFVVRIRGRTRLRRLGETQWQPWHAMLSTARRAPRALGTYHLVQSRPVEARLVVVDKRARSARSSHVRRRNLRALRATKAQCEPWCLATSLTLPAAQIVALYALRMQIELTFRDLKSHRFGWGFEDARSRSIPRMAIQLLLAALASLVSMLVGLAAEAAGQHRRFQANTITSRRVLSLVTLGREVMRAEDIRLATQVLALPIVGIP